MKAIISITDRVINKLMDYDMWKLHHYDSVYNHNFYPMYSNMKGFSSGRYRLEITKLLRKVDGMRYKVSIYWTPYDPNNLVKFARFNTYEELHDILKDVNASLVDKNRALM